MVQPVPVPAGAIRDTIASIVLERGYQRSVSSTLLSRLSEWFWSSVDTILDSLRGNRSTSTVIFGVLGVLILLTVLRAVMVAHARRQAALERRAKITAAELLAEATGLAAQSLFVEAAHRLYAAVITRLEELRRVRQHPAKTLGDYWRELRNTTDPFTSPYATFARIYENVLYGDGACDATRYASLLAAAQPMLEMPPDATTSSTMPAAQRAA
jgi:hypothetical protein